MAVNLSDLAIAIVVLGIVASVGATILINVRDTNTASNAAYNLADKAAIGLGEYGSWWSENSSPSKERFFDAQPEFRLISLRGQDRSVKHLNYARTTDKGFSFYNENDIQSGLMI